MEDDTARVYPAKTDLYHISQYYFVKSSSLMTLWWLVLASLLIDGAVLSGRLPPFLGDNALLWWGLLPLFTSFFLGKSQVRVHIVRKYLAIKNTVETQKSILLWALVACFSLVCIGISLNALKTQNFAQLIFAGIFFIGTFSSIWKILREKSPPKVSAASLDILLSAQCFLVMSVIQMMSARLCSLAGAVIAHESDLGLYYYLASLACSAFLIIDSKPDIQDVWKVCPRCSSAYPKNMFEGPSCKYCKLHERS